MSDPGRTVCSASIASGLHLALSAKCFESLAVRTGRGGVILGPVVHESMGKYSEERAIMGKAKQAGSWASSVGGGGR
jgi:hypothetical protein